mmetsp:Transcript_2303/g.3412  ORF Transcript_2303/g.3412 Transcript_2303/m.3412 type:complete len:83 (+) Transcript_2303:158-406(+)
MKVLPSIQLLVDLTKVTNVDHIKEFESFFHPSCCLISSFSSSLSSRKLSSQQSTFDMFAMDSNSCDLVLQRRSLVTSPFSLS